jgi:hypothetical protein
MKSYIVGLENNEKSQDVIEADNMMDAADMWLESHPDASGRVIVENETGDKAGYNVSTVATAELV